MVVVRPSVPVNVTNSSALAGIDRNMSSISAPESDCDLLSITILYDSRVQAIAVQYAFAYADSGDINRLDVSVPGSYIYHFVIEPETMEVVAHGRGSGLAANDSLSLIVAERATVEILAGLEGAWGRGQSIPRQTLRRACRSTSALG